MTELRDLAQLDGARALIEGAATIPEAMELHAQISAVERYLKHTHAAIADQRRATELRIRDEVRLGELLGETVTAGNPQFFADQRIRPRLKDLGISEYQSHYWQTMASVPEGQREAYLAREMPHGGLDDLTSIGLYRLARDNSYPQPDEPPLLPSGTYRVLLADPPWHYDDLVAPNRAIERFYPTMAADEIAKYEDHQGRRVADLAADDAVLFLWATNPKLAEAITVLEGWGFSYRTNLVWVKDRIGMGYYVRQRHELLLIGRRGDIPLPEQADRPDSVVEAPRGRHSEKPGVVYALIERMYPLGPRVELFQRSPRSGWDGWGNEIAP
jgi:N6-adenosine-specific RNA methylase IME4